MEEDGGPETRSLRSAWLYFKRVRMSFSLQGV